MHLLNKQTYRCVYIQISQQLGSNACCTRQKIAINVSGSGISYKFTANRIVHSTDRFCQIRMITFRAQNKNIRFVLVIPNVPLLGLCGHKNWSRWICSYWKELINNVYGVWWKRIAWSGNGKIYGFKSKIVSIVVFILWMASELVRDVIDYILHTVWAHPLNLVLEIIKSNRKILIQNKLSFNILNFLM